MYFEAERVRVFDQVCDGPVFMHYKQVLLTRIVRILVSNAIRYTKEGAVDIRCRREPEGLLITVQDSGIGIAPDHLARIFDEFYRIDNDPEERNSGLGLGLTIVERSANLLGAKVEVESKLGQRSKFTIVVPSLSEVVP